MGAFRTDPSITLRGVSRPFDPIQAFSRIANLRRLQQAGQFRQAQREGLQAEGARQQRIRKAALLSGGDRAKFLQLLSEGAGPLARFGFEDQFAEQAREKAGEERDIAQDEAALAKTKLETQIAELTLIGQVGAPLAAAEQKGELSDEALRIMYLNGLEQFPPELRQKLPQDYVKGSATDAVRQAIPLAEQAKLQLRELERLEKESAATKASEDRAAARTVTERGQNIQLQIAREAEAGRAAGREAKQTQLEAKQTQALKEKEVRVNASVSQLDRLAKTAEELKTHPGLSGAVGFQLGAAFIPGTAAADFSASLETLASQIAFRVLQTMREASKTGGALGQVSEVEIGLLRNNLAALGRSQSELQFKQSLDKIILFVEGAKTSLRSALQQDTDGIGGALVITDEMVQRFSEQQGISLEEARSELETQNK
jgi:hypothetical protein